MGSFWEADEEWGVSRVERGPVYFLAIALGGVLLWLIYRRGMGLRGRMVLLACAATIAAAIFVLLGL